MSDSKVIREVDHPVRVVRDIRVMVRQSVWSSGQSTFGVHLPSSGLDLTMTGEFDHLPSDKEIEQLPYIKPTISETKPGQFFILTGAFQKGPFPSRLAARLAIRRGEW